MVIYLGCQLLNTSSSLPGGGRGELPRDTTLCCISLLFGLAPSGVYLASQVALAAGELLPHRFTLTSFGGGLLSAALALALRPVGVTDHFALWSPDFPPVT